MIGHTMRAPRGGTRRRRAPHGRLLRNGFGGGGSGFGGGGGGGKYPRPLCVGGGSSTGGGVRDCVGNGAGKVDQFSRSRSLHEIVPQGLGYLQLDSGSPPPFVAD